MNIVTCHTNTDFDALASMDAIVTCQGGDYTKAVYPKLRAAGWRGYWIDAASSLRMEKDSTIILDPVNLDVVEAAALVRCILEPTDTLALLTLLRSDVVGVPDAALAPLWDEGLPSRMGRLAAEDPRSHSIWFHAPYDPAAAPNDPDVAYATDLFRTYRTVDGGRTWAQVTSEARGGDRWASRGLDVTTTYDVQHDPHDPRRVFVPTTDIGLFRSEDGGETWTGSTAGIPRDWRNTTYALAFDPEVPGLVWGAFGGTHDLPRPKMWRRTDPSRFRGGGARKIYRIMKELDVA